VIQGMKRMMKKRIIDLAYVIPSLLGFIPLMLIIALVVRLRLGPPVLFIQERPGLFGKPFKIYKFRTMVDEYDERGYPLPDEMRLTPFGRFLRSTSLDELPELFNVLKGEMSMVGPRPLVMQYMKRYSPDQARRNEVKPGITGWAQINGRNAITWEEKFILDVWYVDNWSFWLDLKIIFLTIWKTLKCEGISQPGHASAVEFMGTEVNSHHQKISE